jgi:ribosomal protein S18 acetylase RimI-like enzyme
MSEELVVEIREYSDELAADMAVMFNGWDELWPGTFTQGVPFTEERVKDQYGHMSAISILIAVDTNSGKPVGLCTIHPHWRDLDAAYIGTLGVSPEVLGKKVGKRLLLKAIDIVQSNGYNRVDLSTWAGNMKAVPLYKKIGMMWSPDESGVQMFDYIPGILNHPLCKSFFTLHSEPISWYTHHKREIIQAPDDYEIDGMKIYQYSFESDSDYLKVDVDRLGRGITAIERKIQNETFKVRARVSKHLTLCGIPSDYILEIKNGANASLDVDVSLEGFLGINFKQKSSKSFKLKAGEKREWVVPFLLDSNTPIYRLYVKSPSIITHIKINGEESSLSTGLKIRPIAEIRNRSGLFRIAASGEDTLPLTVVSNFDKTLKAKLRFDNIDAPIEISPMEHEMEVPATGLAGAAIDIKTSKELSDGTHDLWAFLELTFTDCNGEAVQAITRKFRIPIYCIGDGRATVGIDDRLQRIYIVSPQYKIRIFKEGARLFANSVSILDGFSYSLQTEIGPPFGISPFRYTERDVSVKRADNETIVSLTVGHPERPLRVEERIICKDNSNIVKHELWVTNIGEDEHSFQPRIRGGGGLPILSGHVYIPLAGGVTSERFGEFLFAHPALASDPSNFSQQWIATEIYNETFGMIWNPDDVEEVRAALGQIGRFGYPPRTLNPGQTQKISDLWMVFQATDWTEIRRIWKSLVSRRFERTQLKEADIETHSMIELVSDVIVIPHLEGVKGKCNIKKAIVAPVEAAFYIQPPPGWSVDISQVGGQHNEAPSGIIFGDEVYEFELIPDESIGDEFSIHTGHIVLRKQIDQAKDLAIIQLGSKVDTVDVEEIDIEGTRVFRINNGVCVFDVSPDYGGCMISLKNSTGTELLVTSFPKRTPKPGTILENYFGGVQPYVWDEGMEEDLTNGRTNQEKMNARECEVGYWKGVEVYWKGELQKSAHGIEFSLKYLTAPGSPIILVDWTITNTTTALTQLVPTVMIDPAFDGDASELVIQTEWAGSVTDICKGQIPVSAAPSTNYVWLRKGRNLQSAEGLGILAEGSIPKMLALKLGDQIYTGIINLSRELNPGETKTTRFCLFVNPPDTETLLQLQKILPHL